MPNIIEQGYVLSAGLHINDIITWRTEKDGKPYPVIYPNIKDAKKEIADSLIEQLQQFMDDEREWEEVDFYTYETPEEITVYDNGTMIIAGIEYNIEEWQNQL